MNQLMRAQEGQDVVESKYIASGALVAAAPENLPKDLVAHLPSAQAAAARNVAAVVESAGPAVENLQRQLQAAFTPAVPAAAKVIRIRHIAGEWSRLFSAKTACASGCNHCCHLGVMVPRSEAKLMGKSVRRNVSEPLVKRDMEQASRDTQYLGKPCTFLVDSKCSIYEHRPLVCRALVNMDSVETMCRLVRGVEVPVPYLNTNMLKGYFAYVTQAEQYADIREWFPPPTLA